MSVEYRGQFADRLDTEWTIDVENDAYSSAVKEFVMAGDPLNFEFLSPSDELLYPPVKGSMANFRVISDSHFKYAGLFAQSDFAFPVKIYQSKGGGLITDWTNRLSPINYDTFLSSLGSNKISSWNNVGGGPYETLVTLGANITSAINTSPSTGIARSNTFNIASGEIIIVTFNLTINSGIAPYINIMNTGDAATPSDQLAVSGPNVLKFTAGSAIADAFMQLYSDGDDANFSMTDVMVRGAGPVPITRIFTAITDGSASAQAYSNLFKPITTGDKIIVRFNLTLNSGVAPTLFLRSTSATAISDPVTAAAGANVIELTATDTVDNGAIGIINYIGEAGNWSTSEITAEFEQKLFWSGWIAPSSYSEPYDSTPYTVNIACTDGLGLLKNVEFKDGEDYYNGRMTEAAILFEIFDKIDITGFKEFVNIYEDNMDEDVDDSPLDQTYIDVDVFRDMNCYEVLEYLLIKWNAIIRQWEGEYIIYRPIEMSAATIYGRKFTDATTKTAVTLTTGQLISRKTAETNYLSIDGGTMTIEPAAKEVIHNHDYRYKESWIDNHEFKSEQFRPTGSNYMTDWWSNNKGANPRPAGEYFDGDTEGVYLSGFNNKAGISNYDVYVGQTFGHYAINANPLTLYNLSFDYAFFNDNSFDSTARLYLIIQTADGSHYLKGIITDEEWTWTTVQADGYIFLNAGTVGAGPTDWVNIHRRLIGLPAPGPFIVKVLARSSNPIDYVIPFIKNIKFSEESTQLTVKKIKLTKWELFYYGELTAVARRVAKGIPIFERIFDDKKLGVERTYSETVNSHGDIYEVNHLLGDVSDSNIENVLEQFAGSLSVDIAGVQMPTTLWSRRGRADRLPLLQIAQKEYKQMYIRPVMTVDLPIYDQSETPSFSLFNNLQDPLNEDQGDNRIFIPNAAEFSPKERLWNINASELIYKGVPGTIMGVTLIGYPNFGLEVPTPIAEVADDPASVVCNSVGTIPSGYEYDRMNVTINYTNSGGAGSATIDWRIKDSGNNVIDSDSFPTSFPSGTGNKAIGGVTYPEEGTGYTLEAKMSTEGAWDVSNSFNAVLMD
jgi:hypothetical protein